MANPADSLIEYPSDFPIKIMGAMQETFAQTIVEVVRSHDPEFHAGIVDGVSPSVCRCSPSEFWGVPPAARTIGLRPVGLPGRQRGKLPWTVRRCR